jgi:hypothetical protein
MWNAMHIQLTERQQRATDGAAGLPPRLIDLCTIATYVPVPNADYEI